MLLCMQHKPFATPMFVFRRYCHSIIEALSSSLRRPFRPPRGASSCTRQSSFILCPDALNSCTGGKQYPTRRIMFACRNELNTFISLWMASRRLFDVSFIWFATNGDGHYSFPIDFLDCNFSPPHQEIIWDLKRRNQKPLPLLSWSHLKSSQVKPSQVKPSLVRSSHVESCHVRSTQVKSSQVKSSQVKSSQVKSSQVKSSQAKPSLV